MDRRDSQPVGDEPASRGSGPVEVEWAHPSDPAAPATRSEGTPAVHWTYAA